MLTIHEHFMDIPNFTDIYKAQKLISPYSFAAGSPFTGYAVPAAADSVFLPETKKQEGIFIPSCFVFASYASFSLPWQVKRIT